MQILTPHLVGDDIGVKHLDQATQILSVAKCCLADLFVRRGVLVLATTNFPLGHEQRSYLLELTLIVLHHSTDFGKILGHLGIDIWQLFHHHLFDVLDNLVTNLALDVRSAAQATCCLAPQLSVLSAGEQIVTILNSVIQVVHGLFSVHVHRILCSLTRHIFSQGLGVNDKGGGKI
ncbi:MAG: hypothetical protein EBW20_03345 [Betaproteobacteria bacterium]|nr:hypothetical protein [Betaproteobacteria bacterium]